MRYVVCRGERIKVAYLSAWQVSSETATDDAMSELVAILRADCPKQHIVQPRVARTITASNALTNSPSSAPRTPAASTRVL